MIGSQSSQNISAIVQICADLQCIKDARGFIALAVSGGPDSMALAVCAKEAFGAKRLCALIVDHALRPESADEAQTVKARLEDIGLRADVLRWDHDAVSSRVHVQARRARYALLLAACKEREIDTLLLAHHRDDQAETVLMRLAKGSGLAGLSGMKRETVMDGIRIVRPFLETPKERLIAVCEANAVPYVVDPSNTSERYARGRLRRVKEALAQEGFTQERLLDIAARAADAAQAIDFYAQAFWRAHVKPVFGGALEIDLDALGALPRAVALEVLVLALRSIHPQEYAPGRAALMRFLENIMDGCTGATPLHGVLAQKKKGAVLFLREPSAIDDVRPIEAGQTLVWDARFIVTCPENLHNVQVRALGFQSRAVLDRLDPSLRKKALSGRLRAGLPAFWCNAEIVALPAFTLKALR